MQITQKKKTIKLVLSCIRSVSICREKASHIALAANFILFLNACWKIKPLKSTSISFFFTGKHQKFYGYRIMKLLERWPKIIDRDGKYIIELVFFGQTFCVLFYKNHKISTNTLTDLIDRRAARKKMNTKGLMVNTIALANVRSGIQHIRPSAYNQLP